MLGYWDNLRKGGLGFLRGVDELMRNWGNRDFGVVGGWSMGLDVGLRYVNDILGMEDGGERECVVDEAESE